jgi:hypothetical protein
MSECIFGIYVVNSLHILKGKPHSAHPERRYVTARVMVTSQRQPATQAIVPALRKFFWNLAATTRTDLRCASWIYRYRIHSGTLSLVAYLGQRMDHAASMIDLAKLPCAKPLMLRVS